MFPTAWIAIQPTVPTARCAIWLTNCTRIWHQDSRNADVRWELPSSTVWSAMHALVTVWCAMPPTNARHAILISCWLANWPVCHVISWTVLNVPRRMSVVYVRWDWLRLILVGSVLIVPLQTVWHVHPMEMSVLLAKMDFSWVPMLIAVLSVLLRLRHVTLLRLSV